jgi:epoxyqueuosine reductase
LAQDLKQSIRLKARELGFGLTGVTSPEPPPHLSTFEHWLAAGRHGEMRYLESQRSRLRRADPRAILPECQSILVLGIHYSPAASTNPISPGAAVGPGKSSPIAASTAKHEAHIPPPIDYPSGRPIQGRIASYALGRDYHEVLRPRLEALIVHIENLVDHAVPSKWYTDTGPILERDLAQRAGLGWIGKNTCLISPDGGSYFFLAEILIGLDLEPDTSFLSDHCGSCTRCLDACPTACILPDRTLDARRCISYLTIELRNVIPEDVRALVDDWIFGCDVCQMVCPWNRFAPVKTDAAFSPREGPLPAVLGDELAITAALFASRFDGSAIRRTGYAGYVRNIAIALGNRGSRDALPALEKALGHADSVVQEHVAWAIQRIKERRTEEVAARDQ